MRPPPLGYYVLGDDGRPLAVDDVLVWAGWMETADRTLAHDQVGDVRVSTVFLGLDQRLCGREAGDPILWETMIVGGPHDTWCRRSTSREAALDAHAEALALAHGSQAPFIVAEVSKNWHAGRPETPGLISQALDRVIQVNRLRGYRLHSFTLDRVMTNATELNETIVAVFEAIDDATRPSAADVDEAARVGTATGVGTKVGTREKMR